MFFTEDSLAGTNEASMPYDSERNILDLQKIVKENFQKKKISYKSSVKGAEGRQENVQKQITNAILFSLSHK